MASTGDILWIEAADQRLGLVPALGGGVAEWAWLGAGEPAQLWRPWDRRSEGRYTLASFAMLPWCNRISHGGFEHRGEWHPMAPNRSGEPYPIHGDGWLQAWTSTRTAPSAVELHLHSRRHGGNPYEYDALQRFELVPGGLDQSLAVTHRGARPLPYGLGLHPWFLRTPRTTLQAHVSGVWLSGDDPIPTRHTSELPDTWDLNAAADMNGALIDNAYTGWDGRATIRWPERGLALHLHQDPLTTPYGTVAPEYCLVYRSPAATAFCYEPITQPIDAFHLAGRPGLVELHAGQQMTLRVRWRIDAQAIEVRS